MQLRLKRSQRTGGLLSGTAIFSLEARAKLTPSESASVDRYKLRKVMIYNSESSKKVLALGEASRDGSTLGSLKSIGFSALAHMQFNITVDSLMNGQIIECKSLDEVTGAEEALMSACRMLKNYLDTAATFDGREVVIDFADGEGKVVAESVPR